MIVIISVICAVFLFFRDWNTRRSKEFHAYIKKEEILSNPDAHSNKDVGVGCLLTILTLFLSLSFDIIIILSMTLGLYVLC